MYTTLLTEIKNNILTVTINRPDKMNALNKEVFNDLDAVMSEAEKNAAVKSVIITGSGSKAFVAGADISELANLSSNEAEVLSKRGQDVFFRIENFSKPVIAAVNGFALGGGCELALACHIRVCSNNAKFGQPEVNLGLIAGYGGTQRLTHLIGKGRSMEIHLTGRMIDATEAHQWGLVNHVTEPDALLAKCEELLQTMHTKAPLALQRVISTVNFAVAPDQSGFDKEVKLFGECFRTKDMKEGTTAFLEKRKPDFKGE